jgi:dTDP-4-dehydrorhamnose reductase
MHTLVFGVKGQLGRDLAKVFARESEVSGCDLPELDIADASQVNGIVADTRPDLVINAAAYTDVEGAEDERDAAFRVNELGARTVASAAAASDVPVVYYSTDFVFGGTKTTPYEPGDPIAPLGVYAESKAAGELATREANPAHFIVRTAWLYGPGGNNFVEKILRAAVSRRTLNVVKDEVGSPTQTLDLAEATAALCRTTAFGIYHAVNAGSCSRFEFALAILALARIDTPVEPCPASDYPSKAPRPAYSVLATEALEQVSGYRMRPWEEALEEYITRRRVEE